MEGGGAGVVAGGDGRVVEARPAERPAARDAPLEGVGPERLRVARRGLASRLPLLKRGR